jgi:uncharacterized membrane protein YcaP (DUF421 family)
MNEGLVTLVRSIVAFLLLIVYARFLGKKQISQLTLFDYVLGITIGSMPQWVALTTWTVAGLAVDLLTTKSRFAAKCIEGEPTILIMNGVILENNMRKLRYNTTNLLQQLRSKDIFDLNEVHFAVLEPNGDLSVLKKPELQPVTAKDMNIPVSKTGLGIELIYDGIVVDLNLKQINRDRYWLMSELKKFGVKDPSEVFLATYEASGSLYVDKYKDRIKKPIVVGDFKGPY